jgi:hypothetical protein
MIAMARSRTRLWRSKSFIRIADRESRPVFRSWI